MIQLKEIRLVESAPNIGVPVFASRRETSSFLVGSDGVTGIVLDNGFITVATEAGLIGMPASACRWWKFAEADEKPKAAPKKK